MKDIDSLPTLKLSSRAKDRTGNKQGQLTFLKPAEKINNSIYWWVQCGCGAIEKIRGDSSKHCCKNCLKKELSKRVKRKK